MSALRRWWSARWERRLARAELSLAAAPWQLQGPTHPRVQRLMRRLEKKVTYLRERVQSEGGR